MAPRVPTVGGRNFYGQQSYYRKLRLMSDEKKKKEKVSKAISATQRTVSLRKEKGKAKAKDGEVSTKKRIEKGETTKRAKKVAAVTKPNRPPHQGWVCSIDPGFVNLAFVFFDGATSTVMESYWDSVVRVLAESQGVDCRSLKAKKSPKDTVERAKELLGEAFWGCMAEALRTIFGRFQGWFRDCSVVYVEQQFYEDDLMLEGEICGVLASLHPHLHILRISKGEVENHFRTSKRYHKLTMPDAKSAHDENKRQTFCFLMDNIDRIRFVDAQVRSDVFSKNHCADCIANYLYEHHRQDGFRTGPYVTTDWVKRRKPFLLKKCKQKAKPATRSKKKKNAKA